MTTKKKTKKPLSKGAKIGLIVGGDLLLLLMGWFLLISPQRTTAKGIAASVVATQLQIEEAKKPVVQLTPAAVQQPEIKTANLYNVAKAMPSTMDTPNLLLELSQVARKAGVTLSTITPGQPDAAASATSFSTVPINLTFTGDFYSLTDLLYRLRSFVTVRDGELLTSGRLLSVSNIALGPNGGDSSTGGGAGLSATVTVNSYVYGGAPPAAAAPVAAATPGATETGSATTSTTSTSTTPAANVAPAN